jgi:FKBP-type peptidyl-prolyl cis-trans isomerase SlyD
VDNRVGVVERIIGRRAIVDFNHPLAGKNIIFEFEIKKKIVDDAEKAKALFLIYTGREVDIKVNGRKIIVELPRELSIDQYFAIGKFSAINGIFKHLDVDEVEIIERFRKEEEKPEVEKQPEQEVEEKSEEKSEP